MVKSRGKLNSYDVCIVQFHFVLHVMSVAIGTSKDGKERPKDGDHWKDSDLVIEC